VIQLRDRVQATVDHSIPEDAAELTLETIDGKTHHIRIDHAIGSLERPLSNAELRAKFISQAGETIGEKLAQQAFERAMTISEQHGKISL
jgi:2-methylcitrate dehydratase PrpD